jgi:hypothetical protein
MREVRTRTVIVIVDKFLKLSFCIMSPTGYLNPFAAPAYNADGAAVAQD